MTQREFLTERFNAHGIETESNYFINGFGETCYDGEKGMTPSGKGFRISPNAQYGGSQYTLWIDGLKTVTHCFWRTAIKKIKAN